MVKLSIIIPHYNSPKLLKKLINSIPQNNEIEIIVIDDKSDKFKNEYNKLICLYSGRNIYFEENGSNLIKGAGKCRNIGLDMARGEWLLFADSDDFFTDGFYNRVKEYFASNNDVVFFRPTSFDLITGKNSDRHIFYDKILSQYLENNKLENELKLRYKFLVPWSKLINRCFLVSNHIKFDETIASNDIMFSTKAGYYMENFDISNETIYCVTRRIGSLTRNMSETVFDARVKAHIDYFNFLKEKLNSCDLNQLKINGRIYLVNAYRYRLGIKKFLLTYQKLRSNGMTTFELRHLNPLTIIRRIIHHKSEQIHDKKYFIK